MDPTTSKTYLRNAVLTANPEQLQLMLYDGAIRFAAQGRGALAAKDYEQAYEKLTRAQAIVAEMDNGLREEINAKLCQRMRAIYGFLYNKLIDGNINKDLQAIDDALKILRFERQTWVMLMEKVAATRAEQPEADQMLEPQPGSLCLEG